MREPITLDQMGKEISAAILTLSWGQRKDVRLHFWKIREEKLKPKTGFESGSSPTTGHGRGLEIVRRHNEVAFTKIRQHPGRYLEPTPPQAHEFVYTEQHEQRFQERAEKLTRESLVCSYLSKSRHKSVWEIKAPTQTAEEIISEILRGSV
jgi:hypothetical protein